MAIDTYLQIDGIKGESTDSQHKDWIDVLSYSGLTVPPASEPVKAADAKQTGASQHGHLVITKQVDRASPTLHEMCSSGKHIKQATIEVMRASGGKRVKYLVYELHEVIISNVSPQVSPKAKAPAGKVAADLPTESVSFNYGTIKWTYTQQKRADGSAAGNVAGNLKLR